MTTRSPIEDLLKQCPSVYKLVIIAAKRAKELAEGSPKFIETPSKKVTTIALEEIRQGKVSLQRVEEAAAAESPGKKKRAKNAAAEKKKS